MSYEYKPYKDSGSLRASNTKRSEKSPDYWGEIAIDMSNVTNVRVIDGLTVFKVNGWKKQDKSGKTYLSLAVDRFVPQSRAESSPAPTQKGDDLDEDIPF